MSNYQERMANFIEIAKHFEYDENGFYITNTDDFEVLCDDKWQPTALQVPAEFLASAMKEGRSYRLKPESTWRAFKGGHEFWPYVDKWVMAKDGGAPMRILEVTDTWVMLGDLADALDYQELFADYEFCIGNPFAENPSTEPCGVKE